MKGKPLTFILPVVIALGLASGVAAQPRDGRDSIEWPDKLGEFPTLQSAIDALRDGGKLMIQKGRFELREPLVVRNKRITIEGAGCAELPRGRSGNQRATVLAGPRPGRVVPFSEVAGLFTYIADGGVTGGVIRGLKLTGFDAGVRFMAGDGVETAGSMLTIEDTCIADTGRGIAASAPAAKLVVQGVLIRDVLWNGISIATTQAKPIFFTSFGLTMLNTGQACVVVKNAIYNGFQNALDNCGYNGGLPGRGGGLLAINSGVSFNSSVVQNPNGPGIAASGGTTLIQNSAVFFATGLGVLLFEPLYGLLQTVHVGPTVPFPPTHPQAGRFGDGVSIAGQGTVWVGDTFIANSARAGLSNFGSFVDLGDTAIQCSGFNLEGDPFPTGADDFQFNNRGGNKCGCPLATGECTVDSVHIEAPEPVAPLE